MAFTEGYCVLYQRFYCITTGAAAVFGDLERGASALLSSACHQTAKTVEHKSAPAPSLPLNN